MKTALVGVILSAMLLASPVAAQDQEKKTTITGWPPYAFGADVATILQANSTLKRGCTMNGQRMRESPTEVCVQGTADAPIGNHNYRATLTLGFIQDHLEMVMLMWTFDSMMARREAAGVLDSEMRANYADELRKGTKDAPLDFKKQFLGPLLNRNLEETTVSLNIWGDAKGNAAIIVDAWGQPSLVLFYASAKGMGNTPPQPPAKY